MDLSAITLPAPRYSAIDAWADLTPAQQAQLNDICQQAAAAMDVSPEWFKWGALQLMADDHNRPLP